MLERHQMDVTAVDSGKEAVEALNQRDDFDVALVDVMMPEMDGYVTMTRMRELATFRDRPIIALTAKAMKGDREKCIAAGASDYFPKPVETDHLLQLMRHWLRRSAVSGSTGSGSTGPGSTGPGTEGRSAHSD